LFVTGKVTKSRTSWKVECPSIFTRLSLRALTDICLVGGLDVEDEHNDLREGPTLLL